MAVKGQVAELQQEFIEWLVDPNPKGTQKEWATAHNVTEGTLCDWKLRNKAFRQAWDERAWQLYGNPERVDAVVKSIHIAAVGGDMKAAQLYMQLVGKFSPKAAAPSAPKELENLSDAELAALEDPKVVTPLKGTAAANS